jgi:hypothetical protein
MAHLENTADAICGESPDQSEGFRKFLVSMELLENA